MAGTLRRLSYLISFLTVLGVLYGCATGLPSAKDYELVKSGKRTIVLLRITCEMDGKPYEVFNSLSWEMCVGLANFETGGKPQALQIVNPLGRPVFLSDETRKDGWMYLQLKPGTQYLAILCPRRSDSFRDVPLWRFDIPSEPVLLYTGTLHLPAVKLELWYTTLISSFIWDNAVVRNEEDAARKIAATFFPELETFKTVLMQRHTGPVIIRKPPGE